MKTEWMKREKKEIISSYTKLKLFTWSTLQGKYFFVVKYISTALSVSFPCKKYIPGNFRME